MNHQLFASLLSIRCVNTLQDPAAHCQMCDKICMCRRSPSSGLRSMNCANMCVCKTTAMDITNLTLLLLEMKFTWFLSKQEMAWNMDALFTQKGCAPMKEVFEDINVADYTLFAVMKIGTRASTAKVQIPNIAVKGPRFGKCSCEGLKILSLPCEHMAAVVRADSMLV